jgi:hypothetical protein
MAGNTEQTIQRIDAMELSIAPECDLAVEDHVVPDRWEIPTPAYHHLTVEERLARLERILARLAK